MAAPVFPTSHKRPGVDDRQVLTASHLRNRNGLKRCDAPKENGPHKTRATVGCAEVGWVFLPA